MADAPTAAIDARLSHSLDDDGGDDSDLSDEDLPSLTATRHEPVAARAPISAEDAIAAALEALPWYHGEVSRHIAETLLLANGVEGCYLLRKSQTDGTSGNLTLSVRGSDSVVHFKLERKAAGTRHAQGERMGDNMSEVRAGGGGSCRGVGHSVAHRRSPCRLCLWLANL